MYFTQNTDPIQVPNVKVHMDEEVDAIYVEYIPFESGGSIEQKGNIKFYIVEDRYTIKDMLLRPLSIIKDELDVVKMTLLNY
jgi:hypothetical protein